MLMPYLALLYQSLIDWMTNLSSTKTYRNFIMLATQILCNHHACAFLEVLIANFNFCRKERDCTR